MRLRARLVLGVLATAIPLSVVLVLVETRFERRRGAERIAEVTRARMEGGMRERCEAFPETFPAPGETHDDALLDDVLGLLEDLEPEAPPVRAADPSGPRIFAYDPSFRSANPHAPRLPEVLVRALLSGEDSAATFERHGRKRLERALVRMPWRTGPCAILLVEHVAEPPRLLARITVPVLVSFSVALAMLVLVGPIVRRITRLTEALERGRVADVHDDAADELAALTRAFVSYEARNKEQLQAIAGRERALREYIANTTHDVLAPVAVLTTQLAEIEALARAGADVPREVAVSALEETQYLAALVHNLNAQARLEGGLVLREEHTELGALVERAVSRLAPLAKRQGIRVDFAVPERGVSVRADVTLLEQAMTNVIGNAVRYNREGGHVAVVLEAKGRTFTLSVRDDGPGVDADALARLGERGFRTNEARTRRPEGMGLGLHIVREVAAAHGFTLEFSRNDPSGLVVTLRGPIAEMVP